jgi:hypothetical protein
LNILKSLLSTYRYELWLVGIILLLFWPFTFQVYIPKWDSLDAYLPYRNLVTDAIRNGHFPLWTPYSYLGMATYSDMQSGAWTPYVWLVSLFGNYGIGALVIEVLLCYVIATLGMFRLTDYLVRNKDIAFVTAIAYGLSGFMVNGCHLMVFLIGIAWLPWIIYFLIRLLKAPQLKYAICLALCAAVHVSSASPAFTILLAYFIAGFLLWYFISMKENRTDLGKKFKFLIVAFILTLFLLLPFLNAFLEYSNYFSRIRPITLEGFIINPFTPSEYITFIWPYTSVARTDIFSEVDTTLRSGYIGLLGLAGFFASFFLLKKRVIIGGGIAVFLSLLLAWGLDSGVYEYFAKLPGLGIFKHPSIYRVFIIFVSLILSALALKELANKNKLHSFLKYFAVIALLVNTIAFITMMRLIEPWEVKKAMVGVLQFVERSEFNAKVHIAINALLICCIVVFLTILQRLFKIDTLRLVLVGVVLEFVVITYWIAPTTVYNKIDYQQTAAYFDHLPAQPSQEFNSTPLKHLNENTDVPTTYGIWRNVSVFQKRPAFDGSNPTRFRNYDNAKDHGLLEAALEHPIVYINHSMDSSAQITSSLIGRNEFVIEARNPSNDAIELILNQNYHHLWKAYLNDVEIPIHLVDNLVMGVDLPANTKGQVVFSFKSPMTLVTAIVALMGYLFCIGYLIYERFNPMTSGRPNN